MDNITIIKQDITATAKKSEKPGTEKLCPLFKVLSRTELITNDPN